MQGLNSLNDKAAAEAVDGRTGCSRGQARDGQAHNANNEADWMCGMCSMRSTTDAEPVCAVQMRSTMERHGAATVLPAIEEALGLAQVSSQRSGLQSHRSEALASIMGPLEDALKGISRSGLRPSPLGRCAHDPLVSPKLPCNQPASLRPLCEMSTAPCAQMCRSTSGLAWM